MQRIYFALLPIVLFSLAGCAGAMYQQQYTAPVPPTLAQIQGQCLANSRKFIPQTECIANAVTASGVTPGPYTQEYLAYMQLLREKVQRKTMPEGEARLKLTGKLNEQRAQQQNEDAVQQQLENQRTMQTYEILNSNKPYMLTVPTIPQAASSTTQTNCERYGNQVQCRSQQ